MASSDITSGKRDRSPHHGSTSGSVDTLFHQEDDTALGTEGTFGESNADPVNVQAAIGEYQELKRELSRISRQHSSAHSESKMEQGDVEEFNLDEFLHGISTQAQEAGHKRKHLGLIWKDLTVEGLGADTFTIPTLWSTTSEFFQLWKKFGVGIKSRKTILCNLSGFCKEGEMLLVLGRPGAGCSSLLKVLSNERGSYTKVEGQVSYGGLDPETFAKRYRGQVVYNSEEDQHYPTLTLRQTLQFALRCKTPGKRLPEETKNDFVEKTIYLLGNMLGLTKQMHTLVGNAFVRGLSGGERKRLSIAETMTTLSSIICYDCSTRGLDAASALDFVRSLRIMTDIFHKTTVATLYQASNNIYSLFDKVLLLDNGYCIYFGPANEAKSYFEELGFHCPPRKSVPDFLTGLCNPLEREVKPGFEKSVPQHAHEFSKVYYESKLHQRMMHEMQAYEAQLESEKPSELFMEAVREEHQKHASNNNPYTASFYQQCKALTIRQFHLLIKDYPALISRYGTIFIQALVTASCFFQMPFSGIGAFSRGGAIFNALILNAFISQSELLVFMIGRPVLEKQKHYAMFRPAAFYIAQVILDAPFAIAQVLLFQICSYFMMGLNLDNAGRFFTYFLDLFAIVMMMNGFFRFFGAMTSSFFIATQVSGNLLMVMVTCIGYVIPFNSMHVWFSWIYWINPMSYAYKVLLINELHGQIYSCDGPGNAVPYGPGYYDDWTHKSCTMQGGKPGEDFVRGDDYLREYLSFEPNQLWAPNLLVVIGYFILFTFLTALTMEVYSPNKMGVLRKLYLPGKAPKTRTDEQEVARRREQVEMTDGMQVTSNSSVFSWQHVNYTVPYKGGQLQLLNDISGIVRPGHLTALMGSSGAGKTTLLDVLARRKTIGKVEGRIFLNNEALIEDFERITGYCEQLDIHQPAVTVREAMQFSAYLRQDAQVPKKEKDDYVEQIIKLLEMEDIADAQIGNVDDGVGISVEERKRLTIGMELVAKPKLLFLDEPTSGLDSQSSFNIIRFIRKLADAGWPVLCTIHQPSAILFEHFDHLLLLVRGGRTAYHGEIGPDARTMIDYFESKGGPKFSPDANPAEYILEVVGAGTSFKGKTQDWATIWEHSDEAKALKAELDAIYQVADPHPKRKAYTYATGFWTQFRLVHKRMALAYWRSPDYNLGRWMSVMITALFNGFTYWKLTQSSIDLQNRVFALFGTFIMAMILIIYAQPKFMVERLYFRREYSSRFYGWLPFALSCVLVEVPYILFMGATFMGGFYWTTGLANTPEACGYFYIMASCFVCWAVSLGFVIAAVSETPKMASSLNPVLVSFLLLFAGMMQPAESMPKFWSSWVYWIDPFHYYIEGLSVNELEHVTVICDDSDFVEFTPPANQTCGQYLDAFFSSGATGYVKDPDAIDLCRYCKYTSGVEYLNTYFGWDPANKWRDLGLIICFFVFNLIVFVLLCYFKRRERR